MRRLEKKKNRFYIPLIVLLLTLSPLSASVHSSFIVIIPDYECSGLVDPAVVQTEPTWVWGNPSELPIDEIYARRRLPNLLLPREPEKNSTSTPWFPLINALTRRQIPFPDFTPYQKGRDLFLFQYDWRRNIGGELSLRLEIALDDFAEQHAIALGKRPERDSMILIAHGMGGLLIRSLIGQNPRISERIQKLYLVGVPNLGTHEALLKLLTGSGFYSHPSMLNKSENHPLTRLDAISEPSLYQMLPIEDLYWVKNYPKIPSRRVAPDDLLKTGEWEENWPTENEEKKYYLDPWRKKLMNGYQEPIEEKNWEFCQEPSRLTLQNILVQVRDWRISLGTLPYTIRLLTRPNEKPRILIVAGKGIKTPFGYSTEGEGLQTEARPLFASDIDGDGIVTLHSALESTPLENTLLLKNTPHEKLLEDPLFLKTLINSP